MEDAACLLYLSALCDGPKNVKVANTKPKYMSAETIRSGWQQTKPENDFSGSDMWSQYVSYLPPA
jgi:hypothetical protein